MLGLLDARQRGRMFALKGFFFAGALLALLWLFATRDGFELCWRMSRFLPRALMWAALGSLALGWILDCGLYAQRKGTERPGPLERTMYLFGYLASYLVAKLYFRLSVVGRGKIPRQGPVILAANHGSFLDPFLLGLAPRRLVRYIMHAAYYRSVLHPMFRYLCTIPVEAGSTLAALRAGREVLENGGVVGMFPEGHVSDDGKLQKPKSGALLLAQRSGATVVPVAIRGNVRALPRWRRFPRPHKITLVIGEPFKVPPDAGREELSALSDKLMAELAGLLGMEPPAKSGDDRE
jgi:1-acyl-sn-glycerol-3-phosphate acyltransferase